jgi:DNA-binding NarL/FixJ family response regulator
MAKRFLIVDDNEQFLAAARSKLEADGLEVVGTASSGAEAVEQATALRPDIVLVDISLGDESGFELVGSLIDGSESRPHVVLISTRDEEDFTELIAASRAVGFVSKRDLSAGRIYELIRKAG